MRLTVAVPSLDRVCSIALDDDATMNDLLRLASDALGHDVTSYVARVDGRNMMGDGDAAASASAGSRALRARGFASNDLVALIPPQRSFGNGNDSVRATASDGSANDANGMMKAFRSDRRTMERLRASDAEFARAIENDDVETFQRKMREMKRRESENERRREEEEALMSADPFDVEAQRKIEEAIRRGNVEENMARAMDETPEVFGQVVMLYVDAEINGVALKAFVDSGAQMSIMSVTCARRCGLERLIDDRFHGTAKGVGTQKILGRIHQAPMKVGGQFLSTAITVLEKEQDIDFIFGLDMLRRHQCSIDLRRNVLVIGSAQIELPFLGEFEIPKAFGAEGASTQRSTPSEASEPTRSPTPTLTVDEQKVGILIGLGFTRAQAIEALQITGGNVELAGAMLFG